MSNNFPAIPSDLLIQSVQYVLNFGGSRIVPGAITFAGAETQLVGGIVVLGSEGGIQFTFDTPGSVGSFDQTTAETQLTKIVTDIFQLMSDLTGVAVATLSANFTITRRWTWVDTAGNQATYVDTMPFTG